MIRGRTFAIGLALLTYGWCGVGAFGQAPQVEVLPQAVQPPPLEPVPTAGPKPGEPMPLKPIGEVTIITAPTAGEIPENVAARHFADAGVIDGNEPRYFGETMYFWQASNLSHRPLYFEQAYVERYGYNYRCLQPAVSASQFYGDVALLPVAWTAHIGRRHVYVLGPERPGTRGSACPPH